MRGLTESFERHWYGYTEATENDWLNFRSELPGSVAEPELIDMRQRLTIILTFVVIIGALVIINTVSYVKQEKLQDSEFFPIDPRITQARPARGRCTTS